METTKLIVEYLIIGVLICLAIVFLIFCIAPDGFDGIWNSISQDFSWANAAGFIVILLPIAYGIGLVGEYLGMILFEWSISLIKQKRFREFAQENIDWLVKTPLLWKYTQKDQPALKDCGNKLYGELRFFVMMKNAALYAEIETHVNQVRILRPLVIAEVLFLAGSIIQGFSGRGNSFTIPMMIVLPILLVFNISAILHRFHHYCRAIERSYKVLVLSRPGSASRPA